MRRILATSAAVLSLAGCVSTQSNMIWARADGRKLPPTENARQFEIAATICQGEMAKGALGAPRNVEGGLGGLAVAMAQTNAVKAIGRGCMAEHGYLLRPRKSGDKPITNPLKPG